MLVCIKTGIIFEEIKLQNPKYVTWVSNKNTVLK